MRTPQIHLALLLTLAAALLVGCNRSSPPAAPSADASEPGEVRIAALSPALTTILRDIGLEDSIVGRHAFDRSLPERIPSVGDQAGIDYEALIRVEPTHVLLQWGTRDLPPRLISLAKDRGWVVIDHRLLSLDDIATTMDDLFMLFIGKPERDPKNFDPAHMLEFELPSAGLARAWRDRGKSADAVGRVLPIAAINPIGVPGPGSFHHELLGRLGAELALTEGSSWMLLDLEDIIRLAPDTIIVFETTDEADSIAFPAPDDLKTLGRLATLPTPALRHGRIGIVRGPRVLEPGSGLGEVARQIDDLFEVWRSAPASGEPTPAVYTDSP